MVAALTALAHPALGLAQEPSPATLAKAKQTFGTYCAACHGEDARGLEDFGADLVTSAFIKRLSDTELKEFLQMGRQPDAPDSVMKLLMPAFDYLTDDELDQVIAVMRHPG